mgnify:CR=1 FL=1
MGAVRICLWFAEGAEEAAAFYVSLLPDSRIEEILRPAPDAALMGGPPEANARAHAAMMKMKRIDLATLQCAARGDVPADP